MKGFCARKIVLKPHRHNAQGSSAMRYRKLGQVNLKELSRVQTESLQKDTLALLTIELLDARGTPCLSHHRFREFLGWHWWCEALRRTDGERNAKKFVHCHGCRWKNGRSADDFANINGYGGVVCWLGSLWLPVRYHANCDHRRHLGLAIGDRMYNRSRRWCLRLPTERNY